MVVINTMACHYADPYKDAVHKQSVIMMSFLMLYVLVPLFPLSQGQI